MQQCERHGAHYNLIGCPGCLEAGLEKLRALRYQPTQIDVERYAVTDGAAWYIVPVGVIIDETTRSSGSLVTLRNEAVEIEVKWWNPQERYREGVSKDGVLRIMRYTVDLATGKEVTV